MYRLSTMGWLKVRALPGRSASREAAPPTSWHAKLGSFWATRSLIIGTGSTLFDFGLGTFLATVAHVPTRIAAMTALTLGTTLTFLLNRRFAFREPKLAGPAMRFAGVTVCEILVHGQLMVLLRDGHHLPYVTAKLLSDLMVFTAVHLMLLRYVVFPLKRVV
jgi:putative flippase GtrA